MKADFTRDTFSPAQHRRTVRFQQGRVPLDADLNEAQDLSITRVETEARDVIGPAGAPQADAGFQVSVVGGDVVIGPGRYYVDGILCELDAATPLTAQPNFPGYTLPAEPGVYLAALDVSFDHVTALEDPSIQEVALHGADTTTRQRVKPQVRLIRVDPDPDAEATCASVFPAWDEASAAPTGAIAARAEPEELPENECSMTPGAGYRNLLNQLYRVEIHQGGDETAATFKWSRENGSIVALWHSKTGNELTIAHQGRDPHRLFRANGWVELIDRERELREEPGTLVRLTNVRGNVLTIDPTTATGPVDFTDFATLPRVRRWESDGALPLNPAPDADGFSPLEYGVQVRFGAGTYRPGAYWLIPARAATGDIEWSHDAAGEPLLLPPAGVEHHLARLALLRHAGETWTLLSDCRQLFPPLTELDKSDLKLHNQHLHGKGVVCGLQVRCDGPERERVRIRPGHAIDCAGTDILLRDELALPVIELAASQQLLNAAGSGEVIVTLTADPAADPVFGVRAAPAEEPDEAAGILRQIVEGTLWADFYDDCLKPLVDFARDFLVAPATENPNALVSEQQQRLLTVLNLLAHRRNTPAARRLWLSAEQHAMLQQFYEGLQDLAGNSRTFCGMGATLPEFPAYPFSNRPIRTAFAAKALSGVRMAAENRFAFAWSDDEPGRVYVFEPASGRMTHNLVLPGANGLLVRDVTVAQFGNDAVAVVSAANGTQTVLSLLRLGAFTPVASPFVLQGGTLTRLEAHSRLPTTLLALEPGRGIHFLDLNRLSSQTLPPPAWAFNAAGHLSVMDDAVCATSRLTPSVPAGSYDALRFGRLSREGNPLEERDIRLNQLDDSLTLGEDGVALVPSANGLLVHVIGNANTTRRAKVVLVADAAAKRRVALMTLPLSDAGAAATGPVRLAAIPAQNRVVYALAARNQLVWASAAGSDREISTTTLPAQATPVALSTDGRMAQFVAVANRESMTLTLVPIDLVEPRPITDAQIGAYRDALMAAFEALAVSVAQSLKDCWCDHLLVDCPQCGDDEFLTLARVEIRDRQVYHICNFGRQEVLTLPKVKYWLSAVPVIPAISLLVEKFCCWVIPTPEREPNRGAAGTILADTLVRVAAPGAYTRLAASARDQFTWAGSLGRLAADRISPATASKPAAQRVTAARVGNVLGRDTQTATTELTAAGIAVERVTPYDELLQGEERLADIATLPAALRSGDRVELFTRDGEVAFFRRVKLKPPTTPESEPGTGGNTVPPPPADPAVLDSLRRELSDMKNSLASEVASRDAALAALKTSQSEEAAARAAELAAVKQTAEADRKAHETTMAELRAANSSLQSKLAEADTSLRRELTATTETLRQEISRVTPNPRKKPPA